MILKHCKRCLYTTDHPLGLVLDEKGICSGCKIHEEKDRLNWPERWLKLEKLVKPYRSKNGHNYDCIVPVSGANDSYFIVHLVKERLKLNPLLVTYNKYFNTELGIRNLANLRISFNCDIITQNVNPISTKNITRYTLRHFGSIYWPCLAGQTVFPVQTAVNYKVPLIIWGAHQGLEQVGMFSHEHEVQMTRRYRKDHDLMSIENDGLLSIFNTLTDYDIHQYSYPSDTDLNAVGVRGIYLGNFVRWDPKAQHEKMISKHLYNTSLFSRTFDCYDYVDCYNYMDIHDMLKLYKHGYSKVTDHASREIRHGRLTREQGLALVRSYELQKPRYINLICEWLGVTPRSLQFLMDLHRNPKYWTEVSPKKWKFHGWSSPEYHVSTPSDKQDVLDIKNKLSYTVNDELERGRPAGYVIIGKGYP